MIKIRATVSVLSSAVALATVLSAPVVRASVTYTQPVATIVSAPVAQATLVDFTPFYDDFFSVDLAELHVQPLYADLISVPDQLNNFVFLKVLAETVLVPDSVSKFLLSPVDFNLATGAVDPDPAVSTDTMAKVMSRPNVADTAIASDSPAKHPKPAKSDTAIASDAINSFTVGQVSTDQPTATDATAVNLSRPDVADTAIATDDPAKDFSRPNVADTAIASDATAKLVESVRTDTAVSTDTRAFLIGSVQSDTSIVSDTDIVFAVGAALSDTAAASDSLSYALILGNVSRVLNGPSFNRTAFN